MPLNKTPQPAGINPPAEPLPPKKVSAEDAYLGPVAQARDKMGADLARNTALKQAGAISGVGNYVYRPEADGSITILHDPKGQANGVNLTPDAAPDSPFNSIKRELAGAGAVDPAEAELHARLGESEIPAEAPPGQPGESEQPADAPVGAVPDAPVAAEEPAPAEEEGGVQDRFDRTFPSVAGMRQSMADQYQEKANAQPPQLGAPPDVGVSEQPVEEPLPPPGETPVDPNEPGADLTSQQPVPEPPPPPPGETPVSPGEPGADLTSQQPPPGDLDFNNDGQISINELEQFQASRQGGFREQAAEAMTAPPAPPDLAGGSKGTFGGSGPEADTGIEAEAEAAIALPDGAPQKESILEAALRKILGHPAEEQAPAA